MFLTENVDSSDISADASVILDLISMQAYVKECCRRQCQSVCLSR